MRHHTNERCCTLAASDHKDDFSLGLHEYTRGLITQYNAQEDSFLVVLVHGTARGTTDYPVDVFVSKGRTMGERN